VKEAMERVKTGARLVITEFQAAAGSGGNSLTVILMSDVLDWVRQAHPRKLKVRHFREYSTVRQQHSAVTGAVFRDSIVQ